MRTSQEGPLGRHRTLHGRVVEWLGRRIVSGELPDGSQLPNEAELAAELDVSRGGIREAVKALAAKGLVEPRPRLGTRVLPRDQWNLMDREVIDWHGSTADKEFLSDLLELRLMVEPGAARLAAERASAAQTHALEAAYADMVEHASRLPATKSRIARRNNGAAARTVRAIPLDAEQAFVDADLRFHLTLLRACGNQLVDHLGRLLETSLHHGWEVSSQIPGAVAAMLPLHHAVLVAVQRGRPQAACRAMKRLLEATRETAERTTEQTAEK